MHQEILTEEQEPEFPDKGTYATDSQMERARKKPDRCVHTEHCCSYHGCKYNNAFCPVANCEKTQSYKCYQCHEDEHHHIDLWDFRVN